MVKLVHYKNSLMFSEVISCSGIELKYKGKFIGESQLSDNWYVGTGKNKMMCVSLSGDEEISEIITFQGDFTIIGIKIVTEELQEIGVSYEKMDIDLFSKSRESWQYGGSYYSDYNSVHEPIYTLEDTDIYKKNLFTKQDEFYYENGENYFGSYHQHSNGQAMTEGEHNKDSVNIYRKNQNNKLIKPKPKRFKSINIDQELRPFRTEDTTYIASRTGEGKNVSGGEGTTGGGTYGGGSY